MFPKVSVSTHFLQRKTSGLNTDTHGVVKDKDRGSVTSQDGRWKSRVIIFLRIGQFSCNSYVENTRIWED